MSERDLIMGCLQAAGRSDNLMAIHPVSGGCINQARRITTGIGDCFIKYRKEATDLFEKESLGIEILANQSPIRVPNVLAEGYSGVAQFLLLEWIDAGSTSKKFWQLFGEQLAQQHRITSMTFGWHIDNYIGTLPQSNTENGNWYTFFIEERLEPQLQRAINSGLLSHHHRKSFELLYNQLPSLIPQESAALLHGDLWRGNVLSGVPHQPVLVDPAVYFGHRETELAFTHLFGGFDKLFFAAYQDAYPLEAGFDDRIAIHNLYPLLVHVNLFGRGYLESLEQTLRRFT